MEGLINLLTAGTPLVTVDELKAQLRVKHSKEDGVLGMNLEAAMDKAQEDTNREFRAGTKYALWLPRFPISGDCVIEVPKPPCISVDHVRYTDPNGDVQELAAGTDFYTSLPSGPLAMPGRIAPAYGKSWPATREVMDAVKVEFTAGYAATGNVLPYLARQGILVLGAELFTNRTDSIIGTISTPVQQTVDRILYPFRVFSSLG